MHELRRSGLNLPKKGAPRFLLGLTQLLGNRVTPRQAALMIAVHESERILGVRELAKALGLSKPVVTRGLNTLQDHGYLTRGRDREGDARLVEVRLTPEGREWAERLKKLWHDTC